MGYGYNFRLDKKTGVRPVRFYKRSQPGFATPAGTFEYLTDLQNVSVGLTNPVTLLPLPEGEGVRCSSSFIYVPKRQCN